MSLAADRATSLLETGSCAASFWRQMASTLTKVEIRNGISNVFKDKVGKKNAHTLWYQLPKMY